MRWLGFVVIAATLLAATSGAILYAQRAETPLRWLPAADSLPSDMVTLVVREEGTLHPVAHPLVCVDPGGGWMVGMPDGRLRFGGDITTDTVRLRILAPLHQARAVKLVWAQAKGRAVQLTLVRRPGGPVNPDCDERTPPH